MIKWRISWHFDKPNYQPGNYGHLFFNFHNDEQVLLYLTEIRFQFKHQKNKRQDYLLKCHKQMKSSSNTYIGSIDFKIPESSTGTEFYRIAYHLWRYSFRSRKYIDLGTFWGDMDHYIKIIPRPFFRAFISRGLHENDRFIANPIVEMIKNWGFETYTVGLDIIVDPRKVKKEIKERLTKSDCLIAIATPRYYDYLKGLWHTLEWLQGEVGIAYGLDRPILVIKDKSVNLGGLAGEFKKYSISYDPDNLEKFGNNLGQIMSSFRKWISHRKRTEFLKSIVSIGGPIVIGGVFGYLVGKSRS